MHYNISCQIALNVVCVVHVCTIHSHSEWHHVVCAVCVLHVVLKLGVFPSCLYPLPISAHVIACCTAE